jgi:hypothetical protein
MTAGEDELEPLIGECGVVEGFVHGGLHRAGRIEQARLLVAFAIAPDAVDRSVASGRDEPGARVVGRSRPRPAFGGDRKRLLSGVLGEVEIAEEADEVRDDAAPLVVEDLLENR